MIALFLGTMGLPHILIRFYPNPDGRAARRTALGVIGLVGLFYLAPSVGAMLGRLYTPELLMTGQSDAVVLLLPNALIGGTLGEALTGLLAAGAAAAFLATATGLTVTVAGVLSQDVVGRMVADPIAAVRLASVAAVTVPVIGGLVATDLPLARSVALAFSVAASTFCPLLLLGIWWPRLARAERRMPPRAHGRTRRWPSWSARSWIVRPPACTHGTATACWRSGRCAWTAPRYAPTTPSTRSSIPAG